VIESSHFLEGANGEEAIQLEEWGIKVSEKVGVDGSKSTRDALRRCSE
jgi:hypothetical protein